MWAEVSKDKYLHPPIAFLLFFIITTISFKTTIQIGYEITCCTFCFVSTRKEGGGGYQSINHFHVEYLCFR